MTKEGNISLYVEKLHTTGNTRRYISFFLCTYFLCSSCTGMSYISYEHERENSIYIYNTHTIRVCRLASRNSGNGSAGRSSCAAVDQNLLLACHESVAVVPVVAEGRWPAYGRGPMSVHIYTRSPVPYRLGVLKPTRHTHSVSDTGKRSRPPCSSLVLFFAFHSMVRLPPIPVVAR